MKKLILLLAVLTTASAFSIFDSLFDFNGNNTELEFSDKGCKCKNGRCVTDNKGKTKCACKPGYALQDEETCEVCDCGNNGKCFFTLQRSVDLGIQYQKQCLCEKGYAAKDGVCVVCVCGENSKCEFENGEKNCYCIEGYAERYGVCTECDCGDFGECTFSDGEKTCECAQDYLVNNGKCEECYCGDHGKCSFQNGRKTCDCQEGYKEKEGICERCDCGHNGIDCLFQKKEKFCRCNQGYSQKYGLCEDCSCGPHSSGCVFKGDDKYCKCTNGYVQKGATCEMGCGVYRNCENGGKCDLGFCKCLPGTRGEFCEIIEDCPQLCPNTRDSFCTYDVSRQQAYCKCNDEALLYDSVTQLCKRSCDQIPCRNGGTCDKSGGVGFCRCMPGTNGDLCEVVDKCKNDAFCGDGSRCYFDIAKGKASCACDNPQLFYDGTDRKCKKSCDEIPCKNGGNCDKSGDAGFCRCMPGTSGDLCEVVEDCRNTDFCGGGSTCYFDIGKVKASCACDNAQLSYDERERKCKKSCDQMPCRNGGNCDKSGGVGFCRCLPGTSGDLCEIVDECKNPDFCGDRSTCYFDVVKGKASCSCDNPQLSYDEKERKCKRTCNNIACQNGGNCDRSGGDGFCRCMPGTSGDLCEVVDECTNTAYCGEGATCYFNIWYIKAACSCDNPQLFYDEGERKCKKSCDKTPCKNGGTCDKSGGEGFCRCLPGTSGDLCEVVDECMNTDLCGIGSTCYFDVGKGKASCSCDNPQLSYDETAKKCKRSCDEIPCKNGGNCDKSGGEGFCRCLPGTSGDMCEVVDQCMNIAFCGEGSTCYFDVGKGKASCSCDNPQLSYDESERKCKRSCDQFPCKNGGNCDKSSGVGFCRCMPGTSGDLCEIVNECTNIDFCGEGATCYFDVGKRKASCSCNNPQLAYDERERKCKRKCDQIKCKNGGYCYQSEEAEFCRCLPGTSGDLCEIVDDCTNVDFCADGSTCYFDVGKERASCSCNNPLLSYDDKNRKCKRSCDAIHCKNGGTCDRSGGTGFCICMPGTSGDLCDVVDECTNIAFCGEGTTCYFDVWKAKASCSCNNPQLSYDEKERKCKRSCNQIACKNGGSCEAGFCKCLPGTSGDLCEIVDDCNKVQICEEGSTCYFDVGKGRASCSCDNPLLSYDEKNRKCKRSCEDVLCRNGGNCDKSGGKGFCICMPGTSGDLCEVVEECKNGGFCGDGATCYFDVGKGKASCSCDNPQLSYDEKGRKCKRGCSVDNRRCENGGECVSIGDFTFCKCPDGTSGDLCEIVDDCATKRLVCGIDAACVFDASRRKASCACIDSSKAYDPTTNTCKRSCSIDNRHCENGGECVSTGDYTFCKCPDGTSGDLCEIVDDCATKRLVCGIDAACVFDVSRRKATCACIDSSKAYDPSTDTCKITCDDTRRCKNGGSCSGNGGKDFCKCIDGTSGDLCEIVDDCQRGLCGFDRSVKCTFDINNKVAICGCQDDSTQKYDPSTKVCKYCDCGKNAISCNFVNGHKVCKCPETFVDNMGICEKTRCIQKKCTNGKCVIINGEEVCNCYEGFALEGGDCKRLECSYTSCHTGTCVVRSGNKEECVCPGGHVYYRGRCIKGQCSADTCLGGRCQTMDNERVCSCQNGYSLKEGRCVATKCKKQLCYGGWCNVKNNKEVCTCYEGYELVGNVCKLKFLCKTKTCFGGVCNVVNGNEVCTCPSGHFLHEDICRPIG